MKIEELSPEQKKAILQKLDQKETIAESIANAAPGQTAEYRRLESWIDGWITGALAMLDVTGQFLSFAELRTKLQG